ncbi:hypothetical protein P7J41_05520 [Streptococcus suis]|uniref:hypothetical protein n=1 Tax=Streptococcus suis TaxID=1307 RepID=UPI0038B8CB0F
MSKKLEQAEAKYQKELKNLEELQNKLKDLQDKVEQASYKVAMAHSEVLMALQVESGLGTYEEMKRVVLGARPSASQENGGHD